MKILKFTLVLFFLILIQHSVLAQARSGNWKKTTPEERAQYLTNWMKNQLALDSTRVSAVYDINLKYAKKNQVIMNSGSGRAQRFRALKASGQARDKELQKVLTKEQYAQYEQKKADLRKTMRGRRRGNHR